MRKCSFDRYSYFLPEENKPIIPFEWESLINNVNYTTWRAKVIGGWIVNSGYIDEGRASESMVFVPDPNHEWKVK